MKNKANIEKLCSFYVSDLHLVTMLLPYLDKKIKLGEKFITIFEKSIETEAKLVLDRVTLNKKDKQKLLNLNWNKSELNIHEKMCKKIYEESKEKDKINIIVNGSKEFVDIIDSNLNTFLDKGKIKSSIKIIDCYDITKLDEDMKDILKAHDKILNTSGEKEICEVFEGFEKKKMA